VNSLKKIIKYFVILIILLILFRGFLYRTFVNYSKVNIRNNITLTNKNLIKEIDKQTDGKVLSLEEVINLCSK